MYTTAVSTNKTKTTNTFILNPERLLLALGLSSKLTIESFSSMSNILELFGFQLKEICQDCDSRTNKNSNNDDDYVKGMKSIIKHTRLWRLKHQQNQTEFLMQVTPPSRTPNSKHSITFHV